MEMLKGQRSTFFPYFEVINTCDMPMLWSDDELDEFDSNLYLTISDAINASLKYSKDQNFS